MSGHTSADGDGRVGGGCRRAGLATAEDLAMLTAAEGDGRAGGCRGRACRARRHGGQRIDAMVEEELKK